MAVFNGERVVVVFVAAGGHHGNDHPDVAASYINIGSVYGSQGRHQEALDYYLRGLKILQEAHGDDLVL